MRVQFPPPAPHSLPKLARMEPSGMFFYRRTWAAPALAQDGAVRHFCVRTYAAFLAPWARLILPNRAISIKTGMRTGYSPLVDQYRMMLKPLRSCCIFTICRFARQCLANSCYGVERILVTPTNHFKINAIWNFVTPSIRVNIIPLWNYSDITGGSAPAE